MVGSRDHGGGDLGNEKLVHDDVVSRLYILSGGNLGAASRVLSQAANRARGGHHIRPARPKKDSGGYQRLLKWLASRPFHPN
jgi:hypothetical protein